MSRSVILNTKKWLGSRYTKVFFAWMALSIFWLLGLVVLITIETLTREYPEWHWWMSTIPVNVFSDAFLPVVFFLLSLFSLPFALVAFFIVLTSSIKQKKKRKVLQIISHLLSIALLWGAFWITGFSTNCQMLRLQSDGGPWGQCGYWLYFHRPMNTLLWHTVLWVVWSAISIGVWMVMKRILLLDAIETPPS